MFKTFQNGNMDRYHCNAHSRLFFCVCKLLRYFQGFLFFSFTLNYKEPKVITMHETYRQKVYRIENQMKFGFQKVYTRTDVFSKIIVESDIFPQFSFERVFERLDILIFEHIILVVIINYQKVFNQSTPIVIRVWVIQILIDTIWT